MRVLPLLCFFGPLDVFDSNHAELYDIRTTLEVFCNYIWLVKKLLFIEFDSGMSS